MMSRNVTIYIFAIYSFVVLILTPPFQNPDERAHFYRLHSIINGDFFPEFDGESYFTKIPIGLKNYADTYAFLEGKAKEKINYDRLYVESHSKLAPTSLVQTVNVSHSALNHSPISYIPQIIGYKIGVILYAPFSEMYNWQARLYMSRFGSFLVALIAFIFLSNKFKESEIIYTSYFLMPMSAHMSASISPDVVLNTSVIVFCSLVYSIKNNNSYLKGIDVISLVVLMYLFIATKFPYAPIALLAILACGNADKAMCKRLLLSSLVVVIFGLITSLVVFRPLYQPNNTIIINEQINFIISNLAFIPKLIFESIMTHGNYYFVSFVYNPGSLDTNSIFLSLIIFFYSSLIYLSGLNLRKKENSLSLIQFAMVASVLLLSFVLVMMATYFGWTSFVNGVGYPMINGVQGRYFLPIFPLLVWLIFDKWAVNFKFFNSRYVLLVIIPLYFIFLWSLINRYYIA